ncbi:30S ribosomal protein S5 [Patescibacteria group bacterium]|nr:30S ribosomal protein S5 [Patescibacteria group bacterium]
MGKKPFQKRSNVPKEVKEYDEEVIEIRRVTRVVKGGRRLRFRATVVIGDRKGKIGIGVGKSTEVTGAIQKAISQAKKTVVKVILDEGTIPHEMKIKHKSTRLILLPAGPGTGLIAGGTVRKILDLAGVKNILSKSVGTSNKLGNTYATYEALMQMQETPLMLKKKAKKKVDSAERSEAPKAAESDSASAKTSAEPKAKRPSDGKQSTPVKTSAERSEAPNEKK